MPELSIDWQNCPMAGFPKLHARYFRDGAKIRVRIKLVPLPTVGGLDLEGLKAKFRNSIRAKWNVSRPCVVEQKPLDFDVEWIPQTGTGEHYTVNVGGSLRANRLLWPSQPWMGQQPEDYVPHEFGHMLGLPDEYPTDSPTDYKRFPCPLLIVQNLFSVMGNPLASVPDALSDLICSRTSSPASVPEPATDQTFGTIEKMRRKLADDDKKRRIVDPDDLGGTLVKYETGFIAGCGNTQLFYYDVLDSTKAYPPHDPLPPDAVTTSFTFRDDMIGIDQSFSENVFDDRDGSHLLNAFSPIKQKYGSSTSLVNTKSSVCQDTPDEIFGVGKFTLAEGTIHFATEYVPEALWWAGFSGAGPTSP